MSDSDNEEKNGTKFGGYGLLFQLLQAGFLEKTHVDVQMMILFKCKDLWA